MWNTVTAMGTVFTVIMVNTLWGLTSGSECGRPLCCTAGIVVGCGPLWLLWPVVVGELDLNY